MAKNILVVTSRIKKFIKEEGDLNTSVKAMEQLSQAVEFMCRRGIEHAKLAGRKTVLSRDIPIEHI